MNKNVYIPSRVLR